MNYLRIAFEELLINALKFSQADSTINVFTKFESGFFKIIFANEVNNQTGTISQTQEKLIFKPFVRLLPPVEMFYNIEKYAMGLGLPVVKKIIQMHSGNISVRNTQQNADY